MTVHFCPGCGRINLADFVFCPYCGVEIAPGPGIEEALDVPFRKLESLAPDGAAPSSLEDLARLESELACLERDMDDLLSAKGEKAGDIPGR